MKPKYPGYLNRQQLIPLYLCLFNKDFGMVVVVDMANNLFAMLLPKTTLFRDQIPLFSMHFMRRNNECLYIVLEKTAAVCGTHYG